MFLTQLGALQSPTETTPINDKDVPIITSLGHSMAEIPVAPRYSKMLCIADQDGCLPYAITVVAALSTREVFVTDSKQSLVLRRAWAALVCHAPIVWLSCAF